LACSAAFSPAGVLVMLLLLLPPPPPLSAVAVDESAVAVDEGLTDGVLLLLYGPTEQCFSRRETSSIILLYVYGKW
jgi:hypothetical protein